MDRSYRDHEGLDGIDHSTRDSLEGSYHLGGYIDRVNCMMGRRAVASFSYYPDHTRVGCRHNCASFETEYSRVKIPVNVKPKYIVNLGIFHDTIFDHRFRSPSAAMLLGRLEEELHRAMKFVLVISE